MKKIIINLVRLHKSRISGAAQRDKSEILSRCSAPTAAKCKILPLRPSIAVIYAALNVICIVSSNVSALSYSDNVGVNFTFDQSLTVSLSNASGGSSAELVINNLAPGSSSDSNIIDINVLSNNLSGYTLTSTVGNNTHTNPSYNNTNLTHTGNSSNTFASLSPSDSIPDLSTYDTSGLTNPNVWGYSYSDQTVDNPTWSNYSGLPLYNTAGTTLKTSAVPSAEDGDTIKFKIAAKASTTQPSGEYRNVINFTVTAEHNPVSFYDAFKEAATKDPTITTLNGYYKMQDMTADICNTIEAEESQMTLIDTRDHNVYTVAKLKDNRCWMTTNLDLPGGTALYSETSNVPADYPESEGIPYYTLPESSLIGFDDIAKASVYNSNRNDPSYCSEAPGCYSYYSWVAATAGSGASVTIKDDDTEFSLCPAKWHLPTSKSTASSNSEFYQLAISYGLDPGTLYRNDNALYVNAGPSTVPNFLLIGNHIDSGMINIGTMGDYWSSTVGTLSSRAYSFRLQENNFIVSADYNRNRGCAVRCIANN